MPDPTDLLRTLPKDVQQAAGKAALAATDMSVKQIVPSTPDMSLVTYAPLIGKVVTLLAAGFFMRWGIDLKAWTDQDWLLALSVAGAVVGSVWAWWGRRVAAKREHQIALASAAASAAVTQATGVPTPVPVQPPPAKA